MGCKITFMGSGTSQGIPVIGCNCEVCKSKDLKDKRLRSSVLFECDGTKILIDAGPDFRYQMLRASINHLDAILLTHNHKDHTGGLDDVRALNWLESKPTPIYCEEYVLKSLSMEYSYAFQDIQYPGLPKFDIHVIKNEPFNIGNVHVTPIRAYHHKLPVLGYRIGDICYLTDANHISDEELQKIKGSKVFIINTVKLTPHISHFSLPEALSIIEKVGAEQSYITHISHQLPPYKKLLTLLPESVQPAYDGLSIEI